MKIEQPQSNQSSQGSVETSGETAIIQQFISEGSVVFDVGANVGDWTKEVLSRLTDIEVHLFEPIPQVYNTLLENLAENTNAPKITANNLALTKNENDEYKTFYYYENSSAWSTFYRREVVEQMGWHKAPNEIVVPTLNIDSYCERLGIQRINFLKIDVEGAELDVLYGARNLLRRGEVDYIQFEYSATFIDASITLKDVFDYLHEFGYSIFKILPQGLEDKPFVLEQHENYGYNNFLAVGEQFHSFVSGNRPDVTITIPSPVVKEIPINRKDASNLEKIKAELAKSKARLNQLTTHNQQVQDMKTNISFIMPAYNCADTIEESVDSIMNGNFIAGDELIIVNDGSTDNTEKVLEKLRRNYPSIKAFHHPQNRGGAPARNTAVRNATHSLIFCLDSDNILVPGSIPKLKEFILTSGADVAVFKEKRFFHARIENYAEGNKWEFKDITTWADALKTHMIPGASGNYLFTKQSWMRAGGYPEFAGGYDTHGFGLRQLATGTKMVSMPDSYYYHRQGWESYYIRYSKENNISLIIAQVLLPFKYLISEKDINYIWGEGKEIWYSEVLESRPISLIESNPCYPSELFYPSWGDITPPALPAVITMSTIGTNGRFANQIFQYAFLRIYAKEHQLKLQTSEWIGQYLFGHQEPVVSRELPKVKDPYSEIDDLAKAIKDNSITPYTNVDFWGYFQYHTSCYAPHKDYFCSLFQPVPGVKTTKLQLAVQSLHAKGKTVVGLHLRRGDYGYNEFFITPNEWYKKWLQEIWGSLEQPILFIASDEIDKVIGDFREYNPITLKDLGIELPEAPFYPDFYLLSQCDIVAISNSSFSFTACMLNEEGKLFVRPHLFQEKLIPFDPWNDYPILRESSIAQHSLAEARGADTVLSSPSLPVNFFTIVLNGEPFIRYHIEVFKQLPFKWHWHIVEGVAELKHDTAWSVSLGGKVTDEIHRNGRSNDGTTEYLDTLKQQYPDNITIYRKPEGIFWDGKREMVNAPLVNINEECLLWQVDVDELWTKEQLCTTRQMFIDNPTKTAAWYWCWYFVGENLVISTRNCYAHNPNQEWLRTWRFKPGMKWQKHEPPALGELGIDGEWQDVAAVNSFRHEETEQQGLVFQHFAYVMIKQLIFKETYYGYKDAVSQWTQLQNQTQFPVLLRQYVGWVHDETMVDTANSMGVLPILYKATDAINWLFRIGLQEPLTQQFTKDTGKIAIQQQPKHQIKSFVKVIVDGIFFQLNHTGIARVWTSLLEEWVISGFAKQVVVLDRAGTAPKINGVQYRDVEAYNYGATDADRQMLQQICDEEGADIFTSTYYTTPLSTPSLFMGYDMIPELIGKNLDHEPMWIEKHYAIKHASAYITISENTAYNLAGCFPHISPSAITVAHCGVKTSLSPANPQEISDFQAKYGMSKPYFLLVGDRSGWCGYKNGILFFKAFAQLANKHNFEIVCTGGAPTIEEEILHYTSGVKVHKLYLTDEELRVAYSGAIALVYPSLYEGFGMPVIEAMACGCPVIAAKRASIPEVAGTAALYISGFDVNELVNALQEIQKPEIRNQLITAGLEQAKKFSWSKMAEIVKEALVKAANKSSNEIALIPNDGIKNISGLQIRVSQSLPQISIVTPSFNHGEFLEECIDSVLSQGYPNLEYVIMDGGSTDSSIDIIKKYEKYLNYWQSRPDGGQYAAINQGFAKTNGEIMAWINSDDKYHPDAFFKVAAVFNKYPRMEWMMGRPNAWDGLNGYAHSIVESVPQWSREFLLGKTWKSCGQWIQQESTFWKRSLWNKSGGQLQLDPPMVTADFELWVRFFRDAQLYFLDDLLGGARWHENQRSRIFWDRCMEEIDEVLSKEQELIAKGQYQTFLPTASHTLEISEAEMLSLKVQGKSVLKVSALVSTYNSADFMRDCLQDLVEQTLYKKGELEIIVIDSASEQNEQAIVREFQAKYPNIIYDRTLDRETLYAAWNRGIKLSNGTYITNANTDDRHRSDAIEIMANYLDAHRETSLVYADQLITAAANDTWTTTQANKRWNWPQFNYSELEQRCIIGSQPMWRKSLHEKYGYFRPEFASAGDYEFWLRVGKTENIVRLPEILGLYYDNQQGLEHASPTAHSETYRILNEYGIPQRGVTPATSVPVLISRSELNALPYRTTAPYRTTEKPLVSVIIPTKDRPEMLVVAVQSILNQTYPYLEIIVVNDGGIDVQEVLNLLNAKGNIVYLKHSQNLERSAARNTGIRAARGKYIAYLDDDDTYHPNHIETLVEFLENSEYKVAYTDAVMAQQEKQNGQYVTLARSVPYSLDFDNDRILVSNCTPNLCLMHEKSCLDEVGFFDETLSTHEDWDLVIRLSRKFSIAHIKETTCEFTQRNDGTNTSSRNRADFTRTREIIFNKYHQYAEANPAILEAQKEAFIAEAKELAQQVQHLQSQVAQKESQLQQTQGEKSQLAGQVETWQRSTQEVQAKLDATQSEKEWVKSQLNTWKQTAEQMQMDLDRSRSKLKQAQSQLERSAFPLGKS